MKHDIYLLILLFLLTACQNVQVPDRNEIKLEYGSEEEVIFEATFRFMFKNNASGGQNTVSYYFLDIGGADPSEAFIERGDWPRQQNLWVIFGSGRSPIV